MNKTYIYHWLLGLFLWIIAIVGVRAQTLEYWFDNYSNPRSLLLNGGKVITDIDVQHLKTGLHTLYLRVKDGSVYSPVSSSTFFKFTARNASLIEYWFDGDVKNLASMPINTETDVMQIVDLDLTNTDKFPLGIHQLSMRIADASGIYSPIYNTLVMRLPIGETKQLTYWLDDDYVNGRRVVSSNLLNTKGRVFVSNLDFSKVSSGMHRLKFRITTNIIDHGVVYEAPILVTRRYINNKKEETVTIVSGTHWVDDLFHYEDKSFVPGNMVVRSFDLNPANYGVGQHELHVQYKNSAEVWTEENITYFYKETANGRLVAGIMPEDEMTGIYGVSQTEEVICVCDNGIIYLDCQSSKLGKTGVVTICDMMGRIVAQQNVNNAEGIHAVINMESHIHQLVIVKLMSGDVHYSQKVVVK